MKAPFVVMLLGTLAVVHAQLGTPAQRVLAQRKEAEIQVRS